MLCVIHARVKVLWQFPVCCPPQGMRMRVGSCLKSSRQPHTAFNYGQLF
jgi:hypothetical protein